MEQGLKELAPTPPPPSREMETKVSDKNGHEICWGGSVAVYVWQWNWFTLMGLHKWKDKDDKAHYLTSIQTPEIRKY